MMSNPFLTAPILGALCGAGTYSAAKLPEEDSATHEKHTLQQPASEGPYQQSCGLGWAWFGQSQNPVRVALGFYPFEISFSKGAYLIMSVTVLFNCHDHPKGIFYMLRKPTLSLSIS
ncbi:hypothetical protein Q3G72_008490 [Acer saccharum]|nr:hypothetical protein Q3G72_008490 [Acer saccharum]